MLPKDGSEFLIHETQSCNSPSFSPEEVAKGLYKVLPSNKHCDFSVFDPWRAKEIPQGDDEQGGVWLLKDTQEAYMKTEIHLLTLAQASTE